MTLLRDSMAWVRGRGQVLSRARDGKGQDLTPDAEPDAHSGCSRPSAGSRNPGVPFMLNPR